MITSTERNFMTITVAGTATAGKGMQVRVSATGGESQITTVKADGTWIIDVDYEITVIAHKERYYVYITAEQIKGNSPVCNKTSAGIWVTEYLAL